MKHLIPILILAAFVGCATAPPPIPPVLDVAYTHVLQLITDAKANDWTRVHADLNLLKADFERLEPKYQTIKPSLDKLVTDVKAKAPALTIILDAVDLAMKIRNALDDPSKALIIERSMSK